MTSAPTAAPPLTGQAQRPLGALGPQADASTSGTRGSAALGPAPIEDLVLARWRDYADSMKDRREARRALVELRPQLARLLAERQDALACAGPKSRFRAFLRHHGIARRTAYKLLAEHRAAASSNPNPPQQLNGAQRTIPPAALPAVLLRARTLSLDLTPQFATIIHAYVTHRLRLLAQTPARTFNLGAMIVGTLIEIPAGPERDQIHVLHLADPAKIVTPLFLPPIRIYAGENGTLPKPRRPLNLNDLPPGARWLFRSP